MVPTPTRTKYFRNCIGVFQGGGCRALGLAAAVAAARARGVKFAAVAGTSAGSLIAVLIAAGLTDEEIAAVLQSLSPEVLKTEPLDTNVPKYLGPLRNLFGGLITFHFNRGLYDTRGLRDWIDQALRSHLNTGTEPRFRDLLIPTAIYATDLSTNRLKPYGSNGDDSIAEAVVASCALPYIFIPPTPSLVDGGVLSNLPLHDFRHIEQFSRFTERVLAFTLSGEANYSHAKNGRELIGQLASCVVGGAQQLQSDLVGLHPSIQIKTGDVKAEDFDKLKNPDTINFLMKEGALAANTFLDNEKTQVQRIISSAPSIDDRDEFYSAVMTIVQLTAIKHIKLFPLDFRFVWDLFPFLLHFRMTGGTIEVIGNRAQEADRRPVVEQQKALTHRLANSLSFEDSVPFAGWLLYEHDKTLSTSFIYDDQTKRPKTYVSRYSGFKDRSMNQHLNQSIQVRPEIASLNPIAIQNLEPDRLFQRLYNVRQYAQPGVQFEISNVPLDRIHLYAKYAREYKVIQASLLKAQFDVAGLTPFSSATVALEGGGSTMITPPVGEIIGDNIVLLQGNARAFWAYSEGIHTLPVVIAKEVSAPAPAPRTLPISQVGLISKESSIEDQIPGLNREEFRDVENAIHIAGDIL